MKKRTEWLLIYISCVMLGLAVGCELSAHIDMSNLAGTTLAWAGIL